MSGFKLQRLGLVMEPEPGNPQEVEGVLNPAAVRGPDGKLYLFPRLVARGNYSRIGIARVRFNEAGDPSGVERLGIALEPEADYERRADGRGGCEDPRVTFVEPLQRYMMTYTALSPQGPRIALALSEDLFHWKRLGLATFDPYQGIDFVHVDNKDASLFPVAIPNHAGKMQMALLHRPLFPGTRPEDTACQCASREVDLAHESIWISYCPMALEGRGPQHLGLFNSHHRLATPVSPWERLKIGGGTPPILTRHGWLIVYHGVSEIAEPSNNGHELCYSAGVMVLSNEHPRVIRYRSAKPVLTPMLPQERHGIIANVVFPTGIDRRDDIPSGPGPAERTRKGSKMPIQLNEENGGKLLAVHVSGKLAKADYEHFVPEFDRLVQQHGKLRVLFDMTSFHGWDAGALWEDTKFAVKHFADIEKLAMVGEKRWQQGMATFCKPFTKATIRYFDRADAAEARKWLAEA